MDLSSGSGRERGFLVCCLSTREKVRLQISQILLSVFEGNCEVCCIDEHALVYVVLSLVSLNEHFMSIQYRSKC